MELANKKPIEQYETTLIYTGFSRYDTKKKILSQISHENGTFFYTSGPWEGVLSRSYHTECMTVTIYSHSPAMWSEMVDLDDIHFFVQQPIQAASTS